MRYSIVFILSTHLFMKYILLTLLLLAAFQVQGSSSPNFILILTDDQGWTSLSKAIDPDFPRAKSDYHKTPNMDALLEMGVNFTNGLANPEINKKTVEIIYIDNRPLIQRDSRQKEDVKIILEF